MALRKRMVLYIPYKKDKNRRVCTKFIKLDLGLYKGGWSYSWGWDSTTDNTVLIMPSTTANELLWAEFNTNFEFIATQIAFNNADYQEATHCDKIPIRNLSIQGLL